MKIQILTLLLVFMCSPSLLSAAANNPKYDMKIGAGLLNGDTTYQIGGNTVYRDGSSETIHFPLSKLEFPINTYMLSINSTVEFSQRLTGNLGIKKSIADASDKLKDSDWGVWHIEGELPHKPDTCAPTLCTADSLDIYSESDASLDAFIFDINLRYKLLDNNFKKSSLGIFAGVGYRYENFDYTVRNLDQWYPSFEDYFGFDFGHELISGTVLKYDVQYHIAFIEAGASMELFKFIEIDASIGFSPLVYVKDRDNHVLREKISRGNLYGHAMLYSLNLTGHISENWFTTINVNYTSIDTEGEQKQYFSDILYATIDEEVTSHQTSALFNIGYSFR
jgi:hypothetical protein